MKIVVVAVGRLKERYFVDAQAEYLKRLRPYATVSVVEVKDEDALLVALPDGAHVVALDERGAQRTSIELARDVLGAQERRGATLAFAIGGADGHGDRVRARAHELLAFGTMTIAHRLVRIVLLEQVYRGFRILRGEPYHRE